MEIETESGAKAKKTQNSLGKCKCRMLWHRNSLQALLGAEEFQIWARPRGFALKRGLLMCLNYVNWNWCLIKLKRKLIKCLLPKLTWNKIVEHESQMRLNCSMTLKVTKEWSEYRRKWRKWSWEKLDAQNFDCATIRRTHRWYHKVDYGVA